MANVTQLDLQTKGGEARTRALLEDLVEYYKGVYPGQALALAVWFAKSPKESHHNLLALFTGTPLKSVMESKDQPLLWKSGATGPPFVNIYATSVEHFADLLASSPKELARYLDRPDVLYFNKIYLPPEILRVFNVVTEPSGLVKGWYLSPGEYERWGPTIRGLLAMYGRRPPQVGLVKVDESPDFQYCRGLLHIEISQRWLPFVSSEGLAQYMFHSDWQSGRPGYFLFEGGSLYQIIKFELKTAPEYSARVLEESRDGRYVEVSLRAVYPPEQPTT